MSPFPNASLVLVMVCFWAAYFLVQRLLLRPVQGVLAEREHRQRQAERAFSDKQAEYRSVTVRIEAELEQGAREAARRREQARAAAEEERAAKLEAARAQAAARLREALEELERDAEAARESLRAEARNLAALMASKVLGREVAP